MLNRPLAAVEATDYALNLDPEDSKAYLTRGWASWEAGRLEEAAEALRQAVQTDPQSGAVSEYSEVLGKLGRFDEAHMVAQHGVRDIPRSPKVWIQLGAAKVALGDYAGALHALKQAADLGGGP
jgi:tetratricopeptide (TPR) repeat protein